MSDIEITPESLRAIAATLEENDFFGAAGFLRNESIRIGREWDTKKRIEKLSQLFIAAGCEEVPGFLGWDELSEKQRRSVRAGVRAVLEELEDVVDVEVIDEEAGR